MNGCLAGLILVLVRLRRRLLTRRISRSFDYKLSLNLDQCLAIEELLRAA